MTVSSVKYEYLFGARKLTWENAELIDNFFGATAFAYQNRNKKERYQTLRRNNSTLNYEDLAKIRGYQEENEKSDGKFFIHLDYKKMINVRVSLSTINCDENINRYSSSGILWSKPHIHSESTFSSKDDSSIAAMSSTRPDTTNPNTCAMCQKTFSSKYQLTRHLRTHTAEKPFGCPQCEKKFSDRGNLTRHLRTHTAEKPFGCPQCEKKFSDKSNLKRHLLIHSGTKQFACDICQRTFIDRSTLKRHLLVHSSTKPFSCDICYKTFRQKGHLTRHRRSHTGDKPFECTVCNAMFSLSSALVRHKRTHTGVTPYQCEICERKFIQGSSLKTHLLIHSEEKPFACTYANCNKHFRRKCNLQRHTRLIHTRMKVP